jgi:NADH:ubiquinone oxidoreductase subunit C
LSTFALDRVTAQFPEAVAERYLDRTGGAWAVIHAEHLPKVAAFLKNELDFKLFTSIDAVDRLHLAENDLRRVLLYEEFQGHPLRKDYALRDRQPLIPERPIKDIFRGPGTSGVS